MTSFMKIGCEFFGRRIYLITWISLVVYLFYNTFTFYKNGRQFHYLRQILGLGLCVSRGTATVLNLCCALVLLPLCKKLNHIVSRILCKLWPGLFFFWLERAKSFHMTIAVTLLLFAVVHSTSHLANLCNFSRGYDEVRREINFASYKNESPFRLLLSQAGLTGVSMLLILLGMGVTSLRVVRRKVYNAFWYTHQLYLLFMVMLIVHPLSGALKEEVLEENEASPHPSHIDIWRNSSANKSYKFVAIKSKTWLWMALPLSCFFLDLLWRVCSRNRAPVDILTVTHMPGRTMNMTLSCPQEHFQCLMGQYVLLQCANISLLEWHPFTVVKVPTEKERDFVVWIRVTGDWTVALEKLLIETGPNTLSILVDGPFSSPMEAVCQSDVAICIAAGVGITPFVAMLRNLLRNPRSQQPGRIHLLWIVRHEREITWLADLANKCILQLRNANRPDRLHLQLYVTNTKTKSSQVNCKESSAVSHMVVINKTGDIKHLLTRDIDIGENEKETLLTPNRKRKGHIKTVKYIGECNIEVTGDNNYDICKEYPILGCRLWRGRPHWDRVFGYWVHLYPEERLNLYCCGPKKLVKLLRNKCISTSRNTKTKIAFVHEGFS